MLIEFISFLQNVMTKVVEILPFRLMNDTCTEGAMYHIVTGGYHYIGFRDLMIVSRLYCIAMLKHDLPSVHGNDPNMNICISMK